jgi:signal transduction histidine kinase
VDVYDVAREVASGHDRVGVSAESPLPRAHLNRTVAGRVLVELVDNAMRFSPEGSPVDVRVTHVPDRLEVRVSDEGPGIPDHDRERIFGPLEQLEELNIRIHQGTGMGLALARTAARAMDGDVVLETSGDDGSTFLWTIPLEVD